VALELVHRVITIDINSRDTREARNRVLMLGHRQEANL
jgi:hypothetical protein